LGRQAAAVLGQVSGHVTVRELAWRNGLALYGVMNWVARLIRDGVCVITGRAAADASAPAETLPPDRGQAQPVISGSLTGPGDAGTPRTSEVGSIRWTSPDPDMLRRVLAGLRRLD
jgi:hypothetical protein